MYGFEVCVYMHMCMCRYGYIRINGSVEEEKGWNWNKIKQATWKTYASYFLSTDTAVKIPDMKISEEDKKERL